MDSLGEKISMLREHANISQEKLAEELGLSKRSILRYEKNKSNPDNYALKKLADYFNVSIDCL